MALPFSAINTVCQNYVMPELKENIFASNALAWTLFKNPKKWGGGTYMEIPINVVANTAVTGYTNGTVLTVTHQDEFSKMRLTDAHYNVAITLYGDELEQNKGPGKVLDLVKTKMKAAEQALKDKWCKAIITAAGDAASEITGFTSIVGATTAASYGGVSPSDATKWKCSGIAAGWAGWKDSTTTTLGWTNLSKLYNACSIDSDQPTHMFTTSAVFSSLMGKLVGANQRYLMDEKMAQLGFENMRYRNALIMWSSYLPAKRLIAFNTNHLYTAVYPGMNLKFIPFQEVYNYDQTTAHIRWYGNLFCDARWSFGHCSVITTVSTTA